MYLYLSFTKKKYKRFSVSKIKDKKYIIKYKINRLMQFRFFIFLSLQMNKNNYFYYFYLFIFNIYFKLYNFLTPDILIYYYI